jgi:hypothetical protein
MGLIFVGIAILAIIFTGIAEYRRAHSSKNRTAFAKERRTIGTKDTTRRGR